MKGILTGYQAETPAVIKVAVDCADIIDVLHRSFGSGRNGMRIVAHIVKADPAALRKSLSEVLYIFLIRKHSHKHYLLYKTGQHRISDAALSLSIIFCF